VTDSSRVVRADCGFPAHPGGHPMVRYLVCPTYRPRWGALWRLSNQEAVLLVGDPPREGTQLLLELPGAGQDDLGTRLGRVASVRPRGQKGYVLRCHFNRHPSPAGVAD
jgi:hypothetical protein